ncbi:YcaO-like family protein [Mesorhizobium sp. M0924]|uniref:YcaO-like family protein n=1 Tax=unclassified Mesorhizobium TaxID=325217 RepID=UPI00333CB45E
METKTPNSVATSNIFELAADLLSGIHDQIESERVKDIWRFLDLLGLSDSDEPLTADVANSDNRISLLRAAAKIGGIFRLHSRHAPGLTFFGGAARPPLVPTSDSTSVSVSLNGAGETPREAFGACIGEGVEYLSQFRHADDAIKEGPFADIAIWKDMNLAERLTDWVGLPATGPDPVEWFAATRLHDGEAGCLPACLILRPPAGDNFDLGRLALGSGCAAGPTWSAAVTAALCEVLERDAVAMWWRGGRAGRPIALETLAKAGAIDLIGRIRKETQGRVTTLIDISSEFEIPCIAAISFDRDGSGFAAGFACRLNARQACRAAIVEMCQMELGHDVVSAKRSNLGADSLNEADIRQEQRKKERLASLAHLVDGLMGAISLNSTEPESLSEALSRLASAGFHAYAADLTRAEFAIPVARVIVPGLQPYPSTFVSSRLAEAASHKSPYANGIDLF